MIYTNILLRIKLSKYTFTNITYINHVQVAFTTTKLNCQNKEGYNELYNNFILTNWLYYN